MMKLDFEMIFRTARLLPWILISSPLGLAQGDPYIKGVATAPLTQGQQSLVDQAVELAKTIDTQVGTELEDAILNDEVLIVTAWNLGGGSGIHDHNTIGIRPECLYGPDVVATILLHEWIHVANCGGGPGGGGTEQDGRTTTPNGPNPCYSCTHAEMTGTSIEQLIALFCGKEGLSELERKMRCDVLANQVGAWNEQVGECWSATEDPTNGCSLPPLAPDCPDCKS